MNPKQEKALIAGNNQGSKSNKVQGNYRASSRENVASYADILRNFQQVLIDTFNHAPAEIKVSGKIERYSLTGKQSDLSAWYVCHEFTYQLGNQHQIGLACVFGDHRSKLKGEWNSFDITRLTYSEQKALRAKQLEQHRQYQAELVAKYQQAQEQALKHWNAAVVANPNHPYLVRKQCGAFGIKQQGQQLLIPVCDFDGVLHGLQFIDPNGKKQFLRGMAKRGHFCLIGSTLTHPKGVYLCEGYATGASLHIASGLPVIVAFDAGNLLSVAERYRQRFPQAELILCADNDRKTAGNPGVTQARTVLERIQGVKLIIPEFPASTPLHFSDFNDLVALLGNRAKELLA